MSQQLRVLLVSSSSGSRGGGELYFQSLAKGLNELGVDVHVAVSNHPRMTQLAERIEEFGIVHRLPIVNTYDRILRVASPAGRRPFRPLATLVEKLAANVVHLNKQNVEDGLDLLAALDHCSAPLVTTIHIGRSMKSLGAAFGRFRDALAADAISKSRALVIAVARSSQSDLTQLMPSLKSRIRLVLNGVEDAPENHLHKSTIDGNAQIRLGVVARLEQQKNPLFLLQVLDDLPKRFHLTWVGDGRLRPAVEEQIAKLGLRDRVTLTGWREDARLALRDFDIFVLPSLYEGLPLALLEAMAARIPCIASDVDGVQECVTDGVSGILCPPTRKAAWIDAILRLGDSPQQRVEFGLRGRAAYETTFSLGAMAKNTLAVYRDAISIAN